jgi:hypothetical protein
MLRGYLSRTSFDMTGVVVVISRETTVGSDEKSPKHLVVISNDVGGEISRRKAIFSGDISSAKMLISI